MLKSALRSVINNFRKNTVFSLINLLGFTLGIASFILMLLFVFSETSYDRYNEKAERIYRLTVRAMVGDTRINQTFSSARMFWEMRAKYPEIESGVKMMSLDDVYARAGEKNFYEKSVMCSDSTVFDIFTLPFIHGNPKTALNRPNTIVISESGAKRYFGDQNPVGELIELDLPYFGKIKFEITAVLKDVPDNSHFHFNLLASMITFPDFIKSDEWTANNFVTYFLLRPGASAKDLESKLKNYVKESVGEENYKQFMAKGNYWEFILQPLTSIHLKSDLNGEFEANGNIRYVYIFLLIAFFVLIIACINFMNLSTAKSILRAREVGIKKTVGWTRSDLIRQFLLESVILTFTSLLLAIIVVELFLPYYSDWLGRELSFRLLPGHWTIPALVAFGCFIGLISGIYPAFFLSSYNPLKVLKVQSLSETKGIGIRNILVIVQFTASIFLIIGTLVISRQLFFIQHKDVGYDKENIMVIRTPSSFGPVSQAFKDEIRQHSGVISAAASNSLPGFSFNNLGFGADGVDNSFTLNMISCEPGFEKILGLRMADGRFFSQDYLTDSTGIILNETAVERIGLNNPLGKKMNDFAKPRHNYHVIGIVKDFNYESGHSEIRPMGIIFLDGIKDGSGSYMCIKYVPAKAKEISDLAEKTWQKLMPGIPISYSYMENDFSNLYRNELQTRQVFTLLAILSVIVAMLGLFGLASFMAQRRSREIAIRKVFGAGVNQIINLLTWKFLRWVIIAFVLACPLAWWVMHRWLENFVYRVSLSAWIFILAGAIALVLAIMTVGLITYRVASANPALSLKSE
jgi:putative ABC transport system permease protein